MTIEQSLLIREVPSISRELEGTISLESLHVKKVGIFDPRKATAAIAKQEGKLVTAFDIGGQKVARQIFEVKSGKLTPVSGIDVQMGVDGDTYLAFLQASKQTPFVGISCAGFLDGTVLSDSPNARVFTREMQKRFGGDFAQLFSSSQVALDNDAAAGIKDAGVEAYNRNQNVQNVLFAINGGGFGLAALTNNPQFNEWQILASEPGHLKAPKDLNPFHREAACGVNGATYTCIEKIVASGAGVESTYNQITGKKMDGREISALYQQGDKLATSLYDTSAVALAQVICLEEKVLGIEPKGTTIVYHGGIFEVPGYADRVTNLLEHYTNQPQSTFKSKEVSENAGLTGAAIASLTTT